MKRHRNSRWKLPAKAHATLMTDIRPTVTEALGTRPRRSASQPKHSAPMTCPRYPAAIRTPISPGDRCQSPTRTGMTNASESASNASNRVALPMTMRALVCHLLKGTFSMRNRSCAARRRGSKGAVLAASLLPLLYMGATVVVSMQSPI
ncbi:hypothetical protein D9M69_474140 [compost metagenome]